jgi:hypothetical protein
VKSLEPLRIADVGLAPRYVLRVPGVNHDYLEAALLQDLEDRDPIDPVDSMAIVLIPQRAKKPKNRFERSELSRVISNDWRIGLAAQSVTPADLTYPPSAIRNYWSALIGIL